MRLGIIASQQYGNPYFYSGGQRTSEGAQMRTVIDQLASRWRARGIDVTVGPNFDYNKDGTRSFRDNVLWENSVGPFDLLLSFHSNAAGDSMVLWGTSPQSAKYGRLIMDALNADNPFPGDAWTYYDRKVAEVADTKSPAVLIELSRHDRNAEAAELIRRIADRSLADHLDRVLSRALDLPMPTTPNNQGETVSNELTPAAIRQAFVDADPEFDWLPRNAKDAADKGTAILAKLDDIMNMLVELTEPIMNERAAGSGPGFPDEGNQA